MQSDPRDPPRELRRRAGTTFVCSENQKVQGLEHVHLLHWQGSVEHGHRRKVIWKRRPGYPTLPPSVGSPEPIKHACGEVWAPVLSRSGSQLLELFQGYTVGSITSLSAQGEGLMFPCQRHSELSTGWSSRARQLYSSPQCSSNTSSISEPDFTRVVTPSLKKKKQ